MAANPKPIVQDFRAFNVAIPVKNSVVLNKIGELNKTMENKYFKNFCALETNTYFPIEIEKRHQPLLKKFNYDQIHAAALQALSLAVGRPGFVGCASFTLKKTFIDIPCIVRSSDNLLRTYFPVSTPSVKTRSTRTCERVKAGLEKMKRLKTTNVLTDTAVTHDGQHADFASLKDCEAEEKFEEELVNSSEDIVIHKQAKPKSGLGLIEVASLDVSPEKNLKVQERSLLWKNRTPHMHLSNKHVPRMISKCLMMMTLLELIQHILTKHHNHIAFLLVNI